MGSRDAMDPPGPVDGVRRSVEVRGFVLQVTLVLVLFTGLAFSGMYVRTQQLLADGALAQARSYVDLIVTTRSWNSHYGGVWVNREIAGETNPYLAELGISADATTTAGMPLTLRNPAIMTREISELLSDRSAVTFRLTSLDPVNPASSPDAWERAALSSFDRGATESWVTERSGTRPLLRYMRPLMVESGCLRCHRTAGYKLGDVRGAISVNVPLAAENEALRVNALWLAGAGIATTLVLLALTYLLIRRLTTRLAGAEAQLVRLATTDGLTAVSSRRHLLDLLEVEVERSRRTVEPLAVIMIDIDRFKDVNDSHGHAAGDAVLVEIARRIGVTSRPYDLLGRFGGEEFLLAAPSTDLDEAAGLAERVRAAVADSPVMYDGAKIRVTLSAGVSAVVIDEPDALDRAIARADRALYHSKDAGRNRVTCEPVPPS